MEVTKELMFDHFAHKASPLQRGMIEEWLKARVHEELYYRWLEEWEATHPQYMVQTESAAERFASFLDENPHDLIVSKEDEDEKNSRTGNRVLWARLLVAGSVALVLALGGWLARKDFLYKTYRTAYGEIQTVKLEDGSIVKLNTNSSLSVPRWGFAEDSREVFLIGEASFSVTHTHDNQRFVVKTLKDFEVVVLGTEFNLYARKYNSKIVLKKGKVKVRYKENKTSKEVTMKPGELVTLDRQNKVELRKTKQAQSYSAWEENRFVFEETSLEEVAYLLQENYGLQVEIKGEKLSERVLMGSFKAKNIDELLQTLSELLDINVVRQGNKVRMSDK